VATPERDSLVTRIRQMRRAAAAHDPRPAGDLADSDSPRVQALERRVAHLEELLEGLQDSVHRESLRLDRRIAELDAQLEPSVLAVALSRDARERGL
jgi:hypothetical protein